MSIKSIYKTPGLCYDPVTGRTVIRMVPVDEKTLTPAELKKREEIAKAIERENPNMPMAKKMAIATASAKKVAETKVVRGGYRDSQGKWHPSQTRDDILRQRAAKKAEIHGKMKGAMRKEEVELDELKQPSMLQKAKFYVSHGQTPKAQAKIEKDYAASKSSDTLKRLRIGRSSDNTYKPGENPKDDKSVKYGSPAHMQLRAIDRELKKRNEEVELDEAYHYYVTKNDVGPDKKQLTHSKKKPFATERDALQHIVKSGGRQSGIIHKVHVETGKIVQNRGVDSGQSGYPKSASGDDPFHMRDLKERIELDEVSARKLGQYSVKAAQQGGDKRIAGQWMADQKVRKKEGKSSTAKVAAESVEQVDEVSSELAQSTYKKRMDQASAALKRDDYSGMRKAEKKAGATHLRMIKKILKR